MYDWPQRLQALRETQGQAVLVTVAGVRGSAPRETGAQMIVSEARVEGTIGGGYLEQACIRLACDALRDSDVPARRLRRFALGSQCGQCCGGVVDVLVERVDLAGAAWIDVIAAEQQAGRTCWLSTTLSSSDSTDKRVSHAPGEEFQHAPATIHETVHDGCKQLVQRIGPPALNIVLFGAGHVGRACAAVFGTLDATLLVVDSRADYLDHDWPPNASAVFAATPAALVPHCPPDAYYLIMTHDHAIDLTLCQAILARDDRAFCGLIGSRSKRRRFEKQLRAAGFDEATLATLTCPIGIDTISGKQPGEIAIATAAQVVPHHQSRQAITPVTRATAKQPDVLRTAPTNHTSLKTQIR